MKNILNAIAILLCALFGSTTIAQIEGDSLFATDQVVRIDLTFHQTSYWDSLTTNYDTETYMKADLQITDAQGNISNFTDVGIRLKGNSTYNHPNDKKPFKIDFNKYVSGQNYDGLKKLNFSNGFKDPSMMREKLFFDFCLAAGVKAPRSNFANVYMNGTLKGFYTVVEQIDDQFLDWSILDDDGNLFKAGDNFGGGPGGAGTPADLVYYGANATDYTDRYELKTNEDINDWSDLISLLDFINNSSDVDFTANFAEHFNKTELLRSFAIDNLFSNLDSYTGSARNYYLYHNITTDKWEWIKWDANEAFGSYTNNAGDMISLPINYSNSDRPLLERIFESDDLYYLYQLEICDLLDNFFNSTYLDSKIDALKSLIEDDVYTDNNKMYSNADFDNNIDSDITSGGGPGGGSIYGLKPFVASKYSYISSQLDCATLDIAEKTNTTFEWNMYPNPTSGLVAFNFGDQIPNTISIFDINGKFKNNYVVNSNNPQIDLIALPSGIYIIQLDINSQILQKKLILNK